jgi:hypothetical protein
MRVTNVDIISNNLVVANCSFRDPRATKEYVIKGMFGLDTDDIIPKYSGASTVTGDPLFEASIDKREVTLRIALKPEFSEKMTFSDLRDNLYRIISSSRDGLVVLQFNDGLNPKAALKGFVTKFESTLFSKDPEVQITIQTIDPMLKAPTAKQLDIFNIGEGTTIVDDESTAPHGFTFQLTIGAKTAGDPTLGFRITDSKSKFTVSPGTIGANVGFETGDVLYFSSEKEKYVYLVRSSVTYQLADSINPGSVWPVIYPGANDFDFEAVHLTDDTKRAAFTWDSFTYYPTYWGV